jgi:single-strand DNA-binding protein
MPNFNRVLLVGELAATPERSSVKTAEPQVIIPVLTERDRTATGVRKKVTDIHRVVVEGALGERLLEELAVGDRLYIEGELMNRAYDQNGERRFVTEIHADRVENLGGNDLESPRPRTP